VRLLTENRVPGIRGRARQPDAARPPGGLVIRRTTVADPAAPVVVMLVALAATVVMGGRWPLWLLLGGLAGYSLSGSV
jgi:hypothetical protein